MRTIQLSDADLMPSADALEGQHLDGSHYDRVITNSTTVLNRRRQNGTCTNRLHIPVDILNEGVLSAIEEHIFKPEAIETVITLSERDDIRDLQATLDKEAKDLTKRVARLVAIIEGGADSLSLVAKLKELEARQKAVHKERAAFRPIPRLAPQVVEDRLNEWRRNLRGSTTQGRSVLQRVLKGRITFTPRRDGDGYDFRADTRFNGLFAGIVIPDPEFGQRKGLEHLTEAMDRDYGQLLDDVLTRKGWRARGDSSQVARTRFSGVAA